MNNTNQLQRELGQYMTRPVQNIFKLKVFSDWMQMVPDGHVMEPFAGGKDIPKLIEDAGFSRDWELYDIAPQYADIIKRDMIFDFPQDTTATFFITNNPWLAKNSAKRRGISFPETKYDDLYKESLDVLLAHFGYGACIVPESFITQNLFHDRIHAVVSLTTEMFTDTECPSCLALFKPKHEDSFDIYRMDEYIGSFQQLQTNLLRPKHDVRLQFNDPNGILGLIGIDDTKGPSIKFVPGSEIPSGDIKSSSRSITRISFVDPIGNIDELIELCNAILETEREYTGDVFYTTFKGLRADGKFRRRLDFKNAKRIIGYAMEVFND